MFCFAPFPDRRRASLEGSRGRLDNAPEDRRSRRWGSPCEHDPRRRPCRSCRGRSLVPRFLRIGPVGGDILDASLTGAFQQHDFPRPTTYCIESLGWFSPATGNRQRHLWANHGPGLGPQRGTSPRGNVHFEITTPGQIAAHTKRFVRQGVTGYVWFVTCVR